MLCSLADLNSYLYRRLTSEISGFAVGKIRLIECYVFSFSNSDKFLCASFNQNSLTPVLSPFLIRCSNKDMAFCIVFLPREYLFLFPAIVMSNKRFNFAFSSESKVFLAFPQVFLFRDKWADCILNVLNDLYISLN